MASTDKSGRAHLQHGGIMPYTEDFVFVQYQSSQLTANNNEDIRGGGLKLRITLNKLQLVILKPTRVRLSSRSR
jgi:hypothetical protein